MLKRDRGGGDSTRTLAQLFMYSSRSFEQLPMASGRALMLLLHGTGEHKSWSHFDVASKGRGSKPAGHTPAEREPVEILQHPHLLRQLRQLPCGGPQCRID
jgi:hypothetical protein